MANQLLLLLLNLTLIFADQPSPLIYGGRDAKPGEFPYQVSVQVLGNPKPEHLCGGSIITPSWILTAAHCKNYSSSRYLIVAGITKLSDTNPERQERRVNKIIDHPDYVKFSTEDVWKNDIRLMELDKPLEFNRFIKAIQLPKAGVESEGKATSVGWGEVDKPHIHYPDKLQAVTTSIIPSSVCQNLVQQKFELKTHICTRSKLLEGVCSGDSGGPLIQNQQIIGVTSFAACGEIGGFTKVSSFIDFITKYVKI